MELALEVKGATRVHSGHARGVKALLEEHKLRKAIVVSLDRSPRKIGPAFEVLPWQYFLEALWSGNLGV